LDDFCCWAHLLPLRLYVCVPFIKVDMS
jgi:hypothetical protein